MKTSRFILLSLCLYASLNILAPKTCSAQDEVTSRRIQGSESAAGTEVVINQIDTSAFPKVTAFVTVLRDGQPVTQLGASDFRVKEDEVDQEPLTVVPKLSPLNAIVTIDTSGSIKKALPDVQTAAVGFIDHLQTDDKFKVIGFSREVRVLSDTGARESAKAAIGSTVARGDTALYDALYASIETLKDTAGRKAIILLTDGVDDDGQGKQLSKHSVDDALKLAKQVNVPVFTIGLGSGKDEKLLQKIAEDTGGKYYDAPQASDLGKLYDAIGRQLLGQYNIYYTSNLPGDGSLHRVALSYGNVLGLKEYKSPQLALAVATPPSPPAPTPSTDQSLDQKLLKLGAGMLNVTAIAVAGGERLSKVNFFAKQPEGALGTVRKVASTYSSEKASFTLNAGHYTLEVTRDAAVATKEIDITAGQVMNETIVLNAGLLNVVAVLSEGGEALKGVDFSIKKKEGPQGDLKNVTLQYNTNKASFTLNAGHYVLEVKKGAAVASQEIEVTANQVQDKTIPLNAGRLDVAAFATSGGARLSGVNFFVKKREGGLGGELKAVTQSNNSYMASFILNAGHYILEVKKDKASVTKEFDIAIGQVSEEKVTLD